MHRFACPFATLFFISLCGVVPSAASAPSGPPEPPPLLGFTAEGAAAQRALEAELDRRLDAANLKAWMEELASHPHPVGSPWGKANAEKMRDLFRSWGYQAELEVFEVLLPVPEARRVELVEPVAFTAALQEPSLAEDSTSGQHKEQLPSYNAYSIDGDVTGEIVYVSYGLPDDYEELARRGIDVAGKIVLARYGGAWRGIKPKVAAEHGAVGCLIYSDPRDDGFFQGDPYPEGGYRPAFGVQRGSVADMPLYPGDPLTPFVGATAEAARLPLAEAETLTKIPVLPLSAADAQPILEALGGPVAPEGWRGALPLTYHLGPGPAKVRLALEFDWRQVPAYDVIARLPGSELPDQWILRGNHHDAWVNGATDPVSGMVAVLEEARVVGELARAGSPPRRTIVYAGWDAEEPGLLGSVEWAEAHAEELAAKAVAYINSDSNSRGFFYAGGSHSLERFINQVARDVDDPVKGIPVRERRRAVVALFGAPEERKQALAGGDLPIGALGSGSEFTPFLQHLGIASLNIGFGGEGHYGQYHSIYDSIDHFQRFMDPDYAYGVALAKVGARAVLRLANADLLPFELTATARVARTYLDEVIELPETMRQETEAHNRAVENGLFEAVAPPDEPSVPPLPKEPVPYLSFAPLQNAVAALEEAAAAYDGALSAFTASGRVLPAETASELDRLLYTSERRLTRSEGLPGRPWYRHYLYAPGFYTGYGVKTLPGVREAIEARQWDEAEEQVELAATTLEGLAAQIRRAAELLQPTPHP